MQDQPPTPAQIAHDAELVYNYHRMSPPLKPAPADAIFCLCSLDPRVAQRAAQLFLAGHGRWLLFAGGSGKLTADHPLFRDAPEAVVFARIARQMGVPEERILVEPRSTNTGENVRFAHALLQERGLLAGGRVSARAGGGDGDGDGMQRERGIRSFVLVQKPYMERRTYATFMKQWPGMAAEGGPGTVVECTVTSPQLDFAEYPDEHSPRDLVINIMVGDLVRIREYPTKGYQIPQEIPDDVWEAGQRLIAAGFTHHLP